MEMAARGKSVRSRARLTARTAQRDHRTAGHSHRQIAVSRPESPSINFIFLVEAIPTHVVAAAPHVSIFAPPRKAVVTHLHPFPPAPRLSLFPVKIQNSR